MSLRTLHSDLSAPGQVLAAYACPECGTERRLPMSTPTTQRDRRDGLASPGVV